MSENIERLRDFLDIPIVSVKAVREKSDETNWHFILESGAVAQVTATQLCNQRRFQAKMVGAGVMPLEVQRERWREVIQAALAAAKEGSVCINPAFSERG